MIGDRIFGAVVTADGYLFAADRELYPPSVISQSHTRHFDVAIFDPPFTQARPYVSRINRVVTIRLSDSCSFRVSPFGLIFDELRMAFRQIRGEKHQ